jgi:hypothetical protein
MTAIDLYDAKTTLVEFPNQFSTSQKHEAIGTLARIMHEAAFFCTLIGHASAVHHPVGWV